MAPARRWTLAVVCAATALLLLDVTIVNVALPAIHADLHASFAELQWVIDAYALTLAAILLTTGSLADRLGRRRVFLAGLGGFTAASLACGLAPSAAVLDVARGAQGLGAAAMFATSLALLANEFSGAQRGLALGIWGAVSGAAIAIGPLVGGALVDGLGWEWIFLLNLPVGALLALVTRAKLAESLNPSPGAPDWRGLGSFSAALFLLVYALIRGNADGWGSPRILGPLAAGGVLLGAFVVIELASRDPMLDLRLFRIASFSGTAITAFTQSVAIYPLFLFLALWLQEILGYTPLETGLRLLPMTLAIFAVAPLSGRLTGRLPPAVLLVAAQLLMAAALLLMRGVEAGDDWTALLPGFLVGGAGVGLISPALAYAMVGVLPVQRSGLASGINNTFRQVGIAAGIAGLGAIFEHNVSTAANPAQGFADGLNAIFLVSAAVALAGAVAAAVLIRQRDFQEEA